MQRIYAIFEHKYTNTLKQFSALSSVS